MERNYGKIEERQKFYALIEVLDAKTRLYLFGEDDKKVFAGYVYQLYDINPYEDMVIDYIRFDAVGRTVTCKISKEKF